MHPNIACDSRRKSAATLERKHPGATFLDVTSKGQEPWVRLSPFFPHGGLPVPFSSPLTARSVEGIWQGLKVFEHADVDLQKLEVATMSGIKRTARKLGRVLGHRRGVHGKDLLPYLEARFAIYIPSYRFMLENKATGVVDALKTLASKKRIVLLDYETNGDVHDLSKPLSHASLVARYLDGTWPEPRARVVAARSTQE